MVFTVEEIFNKVGMEEGMVIADLGVGSGYLAVELARRIGKTGKVFAVDVVPRALESVESLARVNHISNIETKRANLESSTLLESESCDRITATNVFLQIEKDKWIVLLKDIKRILRSGGKAIIVDWKPDSVLGPPKEQRISLNEVKSEVKKVFDKFQEIELGDNHWGIIIEK